MVCLWLKERHFLSCHLCNKSLWSIHFIPLPLHIHNPGGHNFFHLGNNKVYLFSYFSNFMYLILYVYFFNINIYLYILLCIFWSIIVIFDLLFVTSLHKTSAHATSFTKPSRGLRQKTLFGIKSASCKFNTGSINKNKKGYLHENIFSRKYLNIWFNLFT